ncbi:MAG: hypothetical protein AMXMBFR34_49880 [Myxococcaceae bacterium]
MAFDAGKASVQKKSLPVLENVARVLDLSARFRAQSTVVTASVVRAITGASASSAWFDWHKHPALEIQTSDAKWVLRHFSGRRSRGV